MSSNPLNLGVLWIDELLTSLLWVAAWLAIIGRAKRRWVRIAPTFFVVIVPLTILGLFWLLTAALHFRVNFEPTRFGYATSLLLGFLTGTTLIFWRGGRRNLEMARAAATWPRVPLVLAWIIAALIGSLMIYSIDKEVRDRCDIESAEIKAAYLADFPPMTSDDQNAAPIYVRVLMRLSDDNENDIQNPPFGSNEDFNPADPGTAAFLEREAGTISLLRQAAALAACRFDNAKDLEEFDTLTLGTMEWDLNQIRTSANVLNLDARSAIARGDASTAINDSAALFAMSRHYGQALGSIWALMGIEINSLGVKTLEQSLGTVKSREELSGLNFENLPSIGRIFRQGFRGDERIALAMLKRFPLSMPENRLRGAIFHVYFVKLDPQIEFMRRYQDLAIQPFYLIRDQLPSTGPVEGGVQKKSPGVIAPLDFFLPSWRTFIEIARAESYEDCARTAVAMTRFRLDHGKLPSRLDDLVPAYLDAVSTSPIDGNPIRLAIKEDRSIVYFNGLDGIDHGGTEVEDSDKSGMIFTLKNTPSATQGKN